MIRHTALQVTGSHWRGTHSIRARCANGPLTGVLINPPVCHWLPVDMNPPPTPSIMHFSDILSLCVSFLGLYGLIYYLRFSIPRNVLPRVSSVLNEAEHLLDCAESTGVIPRPNDCRSTLLMYEDFMPLPTNRPLINRHSYSNEFLEMRTKSHRGPGILKQLQLAVWNGLTYRLFALWSRVEAIKIKIEVCWNTSILSPHDQGVFSLLWTNDSSSRFLSRKAPLF